MRAQAAGYLPRRVGGFFQKCDEMVRSRPYVGPSGRAIRCLAAGVLATLGMKILWGQLAPMGSSTLLGSGVQSGPAGSLPPWLAFTILFGLPMAVSWLISYAVLRTSAIPQPFAPDRQRRLLWLPFCFIRYESASRVSNISCYNSALENSFPSLSRFYFLGLS